MRAMPRASLRSLLLICNFRAAFACLASMQMTGSPILFSSVHSHVDVAPVSSPTRATCGACDLINAAMVSGSEETTPSRVFTHGVIPGSSHTPAQAISSPRIGKARLMGTCNHGELLRNTMWDWTYQLKLTAICIVDRTGKIEQASGPSAWERGEQASC
jgi:hypothetical protein